MTADDGVPRAGVNSPSERTLFCSRVRQKAGGVEDRCGLPSLRVVSGGASRREKVTQNDRLRPLPEACTRLLLQPPTQEDPGALLLLTDDDGDDYDSKAVGDWRVYR